MTNEVSSIFFEAAIEKALNNLELLSPSMDYFIQTGKINGEFMLALKRLLLWVETKTIEAALSAMDSARKDEAVQFAEWIERDYAFIHSEELKRSAWVNCTELNVLAHGSDYHYTELIKYYGKSTPELYELFLKSKSKP